jgi:hypothetical protein
VPPVLLLLQAGQARSWECCYLNIKDANCADLCIIHSPEQRSM